jgi:hypothetical protein
MHNNYLFTFAPYVLALQKKVSLYAKWFHEILNEFTGCSEQGLVNKQQIHWSSERGIVNYIHIL